MIDTANPPQLRMAEYNGRKIRIYRPFRSAPANWIPMPPIKMDKIPFLKNHGPKNTNGSIFPPLVAIPTLATGSSKDFGQVLAFHEDWGDDFTKIGQFPMDSIRLDELGFVEGEGAPLSDSFIENILTHLRILSRQWWIGKSVDRIMGNKRVEFKCDSFGKPIQDNPWMHASNRTLSGIERLIDRGNWEKAVELTCDGCIPDMHKSLFLDAQFHLACGDISRAVFDATTACESLKDTTIEALWKKHNIGRYKKGDVLHGYDLHKHVDQAVRALVDRSFKNEFPKDFCNIKWLWLTRGNIAHGKPPFYHDGNNRVEVDEAQVKEMLLSADQLLNWLQSLID